ncbi:MAG: hypothetical protein WBI20_04515 [Burkholderiaceae bacterium]
MGQDFFSGALLEWELALSHVGWHHGLFALAYGVCAWFCVVAAYAARQNQENPQPWWLAAVLLLLLGLNTVFQLDLLLVLLLRTGARLQGWYQERRLLQYPLLLTLGASGLVLLAWLRTRIENDWPLLWPIVLGLGLLVAVAGLRLVSFHASDELLDARLWGVSTGRWLELAGMIGVVAGARNWLTTR